MNQRTKRLLIVLLYLAIGALVAYFVLPKLLVVFMPFIVAAILASLIEPLIVAMMSKMKMPRALAAAISVFLTLIVIGGLVTMIIAKIVNEIYSLIENWPGIYMMVQDQVGMWSDHWNNYYITMPPGIKNIVDIAYETASSQLSSLLSPVTDFSITFAKNFAMGLPSALIFIVVMFLSTYFFASDNKRLPGLFKRIFPKRFVESTIQIKGDFKNAIGGYIRAQGILMSVVFAIVLVGMLIMRIPYALVIALGIAIFDALPVFGSGGVLLPWSIIGFIMGDMRIGIGMLILYVVILLTRQILEPKVVSGQIGLPPIFTIMAMYAGLKLFGIIGMILGPVVVLTIKSLYASGAFDSLLESKNETSDKEGEEINQYE